MGLTKWLNGVSDLARRVQVGLQEAVQNAQAGLEGVPKLENENGQELLVISVARTTPTTLISPGTMVRIMVRDQKIEFDEVYGDKRTLLSYPAYNMIEPRNMDLATSGGVWGFFQDWHNVNKYGFWDSYAARNLQNIDYSAAGFGIGFHIPETEEVQTIAGYIAASNKMDVSDACTLLRALKRRLRKAKQIELLANQDQVGIKQRLQTLVELRDNGAITEEEFTEKRASILNGI